MMLDDMDARLLAALGAGFISLSAIFTKLAGTSAGTAAFFRCALALLVLLPLALRERGRWHLPDLLAGLLLGADFVLWGHAIGDVGAGIATVAVNVQVLVVPLLALLVSGERPARRFWITAPVILAGVALAAGMADAKAFGEHPVRGVLFSGVAGVLYGMYLFLLRRGGRAGKRFVPVTSATVTAAVASLALGSVLGGIDLAPGWPAFGWLVALALSGQVAGWLLIGAALPRLSSSVGATLLLIQPVGAVAFGMALLGERPGPWQLAGCAVVVGVVWFNAMSPKRSRDGDEQAKHKARHGSHLIAARKRCADSDERRHRAADAAVAAGGAR